MARALALALLIVVAAATVAAAPAAEPLGKKTAAPPYKLTCQMYPIVDDHEGAFKNYNCFVATFLTKPMCVRLNCPGVTIGPAPIGGSGAGTNIVRPRPYSQGLGPQCNSLQPVYPGSSFYFGFLVRQETAAHVSVAGFYPPVDGNTC